MITLEQAMEKFNPSLDLQVIHIANVKDKALGVWYFRNDEIKFKVIYCKLDNGHKPFYTLTDAVRFYNKMYQEENNE